MGQFHVFLAGILGHLMVQNVQGLELAPIAYVPLELRHLFQPDEWEDDYEHPGIVDRNRRASGQETVQEEYTYILYSLGGAPCIMVQTECTFRLKYHTLRQGLRTVLVELPKEPEVSGSCVRDGDTAVLTMRWSVFNFSLVFTQNPEGNSYYMNKAILKYNQSLDIFTDATYRGPVVLQTPSAWNYYFTPLGQSYVCEEGEDQGPLDLYNEEDHLVGNMTLWNSRFQPFVTRAKGDWGPESHCLPKAIQIMREDVVPFVTAGIFSATVFVLLAGYGLYRKFHVKKTTYETYGDPSLNQDMEAHEMKINNGSSSMDYEDDLPATTNHTVVPQAAPAPPQNAANPFTNKAKTNPFQQKTESFGAAI